MLSFFCAYKMSSASWLSYSTSLCPFTLTLTGILHHAPTAKYCSEGEHEHFFQCLYCWLWTSKCLLWSFLNKTLILCLVCLQTVELLEITESIPSFYQWLFTCQNHHHSSIQPWHIARWILEIAFGMTRYAWPHPYEWTESHWCFYVGLTHLLGTTEQTPTSMDPLSHAKNNFKAQLILVMKLTQHSA